MMNPELVAVLDDIDLAAGVAGFVLGFEYGSGEVPLTELSVSGAMNYIKASAEETWVLDVLSKYDVETGSERLKTLVAKFLKEAGAAVTDILEGDKSDDHGDPDKDADI